MTDMIYQEIVDERLRQDTKWGIEFDDKNTSSDWVSYITDYAARTVSLTGLLDEDARRRALIKVAALAVAAIEAQDRVGIVPSASCLRHFEAKGMDSLLAHAILDMDDHGYSEGLGPKADHAEAWEKLVLEAEAATGRKTVEHC